MKRLLVAIFTLVSIMTQAQIPYFNFPVDGQHSAFKEKAINENYTLIKENDSEFEPISHSSWKGEFWGEICDIHITYSTLTGDILTTSLRIDIFNTKERYMPIVNEISKSLGYKADINKADLTAYWADHDLLAKINGSIITIFYSDIVNKAKHERAVKRARHK